MVVAKGWGRAEERVEGRAETDCKTDICLLDEAHLELAAGAIAWYILLHGGSEVDRKSVV